METIGISSEEEGTKEEEQVKRKIVKTKYDKPGYPQDNQQKRTNKIGKQDNKNDKHNSNNSTNDNKTIIWTTDDSMEDYEDEGKRKKREMKESRKFRDYKKTRKDKKETEKKDANKYIENKQGEKKTDGSITGIKNNKDRTIDISEHQITREGIYPTDMKEAIMNNTIDERMIDEIWELELWKGREVTEEEDRMAISDSSMEIGRDGTDNKEATTRITDWTRKATREHTKTNHIKQNKDTQPTYKNGKRCTNNSHKIMRWVNDQNYKKARTPYLIIIIKHRLRHDAR